MWAVSLSAYAYAYLHTFIRLLGVSAALMLRVFVLLVSRRTSVDSLHPCTRHASSAFVRGVGSLSDLTFLTSCIIVSVLRSSHFCSPLHPRTNAGCTTKMTTLKRLNGRGRPYDSQQKGGSCKGGQGGKGGRRRRRGGNGLGLRIFPSYS